MDMRMTWSKAWRAGAIALALAAGLAPAMALDAGQAQTMARGEDSESRIAALQAAVSAAALTPDPRLQAFLQALAGEQLRASGERLLILHADGSAEDALTGARVSPVPEALDELMINNRLRGELDQALAALKLFSGPPAERLAAARALQQDASEERLPLLDRALARETDEAVRRELSLARAAALIASADAGLRLQAARALGHAEHPALLQRVDVAHDDGGVCGRARLRLVPAPSCSMIAPVHGHSPKSSFRLTLRQRQAVDQPKSWRSRVVSGSGSRATVASGSTAARRAGGRICGAGRVHDEDLG